jgi:AraC family transcriptional regulator, melibiose operon regulatory protein
MSYIQKHYSEELSLDELSATVNLSKSECCRLFKRTTGNTPFEYLLAYRIKQSISMMESGNKSIGEIASLTGFNSFSYYSVCFKKITGMTPKQYRKNINSQNSSVSAPTPMS